MKKIYKNLLLLSSILVITVFSPKLVQAAEPNMQKNIIQVNGKATIKVKPDIVHIDANVITEDKNAKKAQAENAKAIEAIKKAVTTKYNLKEDDITTINYSVSPSYDYVDGKQIFRNYTVEHTLRMTLNETEKAGEMLDTLIENGATTVGNIIFGIKDEAEAYNKALQKAVQDATQKANAITTILGVKKATPIAITELTESQGQFEKNEMLMQDSVAGSNPSTTIQQSDIEVVASVQVTLQW